MLKYPNLFRRNVAKHLNLWLTYWYMWGVAFRGQNVVQKQPLLRVLENIFALIKFPKEDKMCLWLTAIFLVRIRDSVREDSYLNVAFCFGSFAMHRKQFNRKKCVYLQIFRLVLYITGWWRRATWKKNNLEVENVQVYKLKNKRDISWFQYWNFNAN